MFSNMFLLSFGGQLCIVLTLLIAVLVAGEDGVFIGDKISNVQTSTPGGQAFTDGYTPTSTQNTTATRTPIIMIAANMYFSAAVSECGEALPEFYTLLLNLIDDLGFAPVVQLQSIRLHGNAVFLQTSFNVSSLDSWMSIRSAIVQSNFCLTTTNTSTFCAKLTQDNFTTPACANSSALGTNETITESVDNGTRSEAWYEKSTVLGIAFGTMLLIILIA